MTEATVVGFSGNITRPSKTRSFIDKVVGEAAQRYGLRPSVFDIQDLGPTFPAARRLGDLDEHALAMVDAVVGADLLVVGSPTFKGSYTGLFKHFFDLLDPAALKGKPVILTATGGGERHALVVEHQLRPLFGFFEAFTLPTAIYATDRDFADGALIGAGVTQRALLAVEQAGLLVGGGGLPSRIAAE